MLDEFENCLSRINKMQITNGFGKQNKNLHTIEFNYQRFIVIIRKGTREFFSKLCKKFNIYIVSKICKDLIL
jgi:hypothetical protein